MFWKILFVIFAAVFLFLQLGGITNTLHISEFTVLMGYLLNVACVFISGYFYSLGWNVKLYGKNVNNCIFTFLMLFIVTMICIALYTGFAAMSIDMKFLQNADYAISFTRLIFLVFSVYSLLAIPIIIAFFNYKNRIETLREIDRPYWKVFAIYMALALNFNNLYCIVFDNVQNYNVLDIVFVLLCLIGTLFCLLYAYNFKIGKQIIWKFLLFPYLLLTGCVFFMLSPEYLNFSGLYTTTASYVSLVFNVIISAVFMYSLYRYAFTNDVYND